MTSYSSVVVVGAAGWLGRNLTHALLHGLPDCPDLTSPPFAALPLRLVDAAPIETTEDYRAAQVDVVQADITRAADCARIFEGVPKGALVLHCAGVIHPRRAADFNRVNLTGTAQVYAAAQNAGAARMVVVSSNSPCGCNRSRDGRFDEESPYNPYMGYGRSKMLMEQHLRGQPDSALPWTLIRAPWFYGAFQPPRQSLFFRMIRDGRGPVVGGGDNLRSMAYTDNLSQGIIRAALSARAARQIYWIADAAPYTMNQVIDTIEKLLEEEFGIACRRARLRLPGVAAEVALVCDWLLQRAGLYHQKIHVLSEMNKTIACDIGKARDELGYAPMISLQEGMRRSIADCIANGGL